MFKDGEINRRNRADYGTNLRAFAQAIRAGKEELERFLLEGAALEPYEHIPDHTRCTYGKNPTLAVTEKRLCRCMYFYGKTAECERCPFPEKRKNGTPEIHIVDYERPTPYKAASLGGIDLVWERHGETYAVEVKPPNSTETLIRMVAEILTYTWGSPGCRPAICFFRYDSAGKASKQWQEYLNWKDDPDFQVMMGTVRLFYITQDGARFYIHDGEGEPICE